MNPCVPDHDGTIDSWYKAINSMFGEVVQCNTGGFDADVDQTPPFVSHMPPNDLFDCFSFPEITTGKCITYNEVHIRLIEHIESSIDTQLTPPRNTQKATIVWRVKPEICDYMDFDANKQFWRGYSRVRVLDKHSQSGYFW